MDVAKRYKYLLAMDGSVHAHRAAQFLARRAAALRPAEAIIVNALHGAPAPDKGPFEADAAAAQAARMLEAAGVPATVLTPLGDPARMIVEASQTNGCDEIVLGSRGAGAMENFAIGSVAYKVAHLATVPVTIVPNPFGSAELELEDSGGAHRILLAADGSAYATRAADYVCRLKGARVPLAVCLLNVQLPIVSRQVGRYVSKATMDAFLEEEGKEALAGAAAVLAAAGLQAETRVRIGQVARTIVHEAGLIGATRIVLGSRGLGALAGMMLGSTALQVMHLAELPVTLVK
jgi:nucleotide-binding universal stress UspA family protein